MTARRTRWACTVVAAWTLTTLAAVAAAPAGAAPARFGSAPARRGPHPVAHTPRGVVWRIGHHRAAASTATVGSNPLCPGCSPPLKFTAGSYVMGGLSATPGAATITPVFWAPGGYGFDASYKRTIVRYISDVAADSGGADNVFAVADEYYQQTLSGSTQYIRYNVTAGAELDISDSFPTTGTCTLTRADIAANFRACVDDASLAGEVAHVLSADGLSSDDSHLYLFFFPSGVATCFLASSTSATGNQCSTNAYCAYHANVGGEPAPAIYADMPYPDLAGCAPPGDVQAPNGNSYADTQVSMVSHEANESITDWSGAWYDSSGNEDGDECAYVYGSSLGSTGAAKDPQANGTDYNQLVNGHGYYTQDEFSNAAYALGTGTAVSGASSTPVYGCLQRPAPDPPTDVNTNVGFDTANVSWVAPTQQGRGPVTGYDVYEATTAGAESATPINATPVTGTSYQVGGLTNGRTYYFVVRATNGAGSSPASVEAAATPSNATFSKQPGAGSDIAVGADSSVWIVGTANIPGGHGIYRWTGTGWAAVAGAAVAIAVGPDGSPWVVNSSHNLYHRVGASWVRLPGAGTDIAVGANGSVWVVGTNNVAGGHGIYRWTGTGWAAVAGGAVAIAVGPDGSPWVVNSSHNLYHRVGASWVYLPGAGTDIAVGANGSAWILGTAGIPGGHDIYRWTGTGRAAVAGGAVTIAVTPAGRPWIIASDQTVYSG